MRNVLAAAVLALFVPGCAVAPPDFSVGHAARQATNSDTAKVEQLVSLANSGRVDDALRDGYALWTSGTLTNEGTASLCLFFARTYIDRRMPNAAFQWLVCGYNAAQSKESHEEIVEIAKELISSINRSALGALLRQNPPEPIARLIRQKLALTPVEVQVQPRNDQYAVDPQRIGCLLPMSGKYAKFGREIANGLKQAVVEWRQRHPAEPVSILIKDTQADPTLDARGLAELVQDEGVLAVIGPLNRESTRSVGEVADRLRVPVLALAELEGESRSTYMIQVLIDSQEMCEELIARASTEGARRFAVLYPQDRYGQRLARAFVAAAEHAGVSIVSVVSYKPAITDFQETVKHLIAEAGKHTLSDNSQPMDALFIPDSFQTASLIAPYLPYYNAVGVRLLGTNRWDSAEAYQPAEMYMEGAIFIAEPDSGMAGGYLAAQARDALFMLLETRQRSGLSSRQTLLQALNSIEEFHGLTGTQFIENGLVHRVYQVKQISGGQILSLR